MVNRLLTGFDAPCLSTVFIDRQPMHPHDIIQTFSRTNRLFDKNKAAGQIVTFQSPHLFKKAVDEALVLFSAGGEASAISPSWNEVHDQFKKSLAYLRVTAETPSIIATLSKEGKLRFAKAFQDFDKIYSSLKAFTKYADNPPDSYGITEDEYEEYAAWYLNIREQYRPDPKPNGGEDDVHIDLEYELKAYSKEKIDYDYIVSLIQSVVSASEEERNETHYKNLIEDISKYIDELLITNPKLGELMRELWSKVQNNPQEFKDKRVAFVLEDMRKETIRGILESFSEEWCVSLEAVVYSAERYISGSADLPGINNLKSGADFDRYSENHTGVSKFKYHQLLKKSLIDLLNNEILPIRDNDYRLNEAKLPTVQK